MNPRKLSARKYHLLNMLLLSALIPVSCLIPVTAAEPVSVPLTRDNMALLLERTVQSKLIPVTMKDDSGFSITLTGLKSFTMNWDTNEFKADLTFQAEYVSKWLPIHIRQDGETVVSGCGLFSAEEQKLGVKLVRIDDMQFHGLLQIAHEPIRKLLNKKLSGKELWQGGAPAQSATLTGDNWTEMLRIGIAEELPHAGVSGKISYTLTKLNSLTALDGPGRFAAEFVLDGRHQGLVSLGFEGVAAVSASVWVVPDELRGKVRIEEVQRLDLKRVPAFIDAIIRRSLSDKLNTEEFEFSWS